MQVSGESSGGLNGSPTLAHLSFTAFGPVATSSELSAQALRFADPAGVPYAAAPGSLLVVVGKQGDVNLDGSVSAVDALCVLRQVARLAATGACPQTASTRVMADVNADSQTNAVDALCVLRLVAQLAATNACPILVTSTPSSSSTAQAGATGGEAARARASTTASASATTSVQGTSVGLRLSLSAVASERGTQTRVDLEVDTGSAAGSPDVGMLGAWTVDVKYDPKAVRVVSCAGVVGSVCNPAYAPGVVRIVGASSGGLKAGSLSGGLATLTVEGIGGRGPSNLTLDHVSLVDPQGLALTAS